MDVGLLLLVVGAVLLAGVAAALVAKRVGGSGARCVPRARDASWQRGVRRAVCSRSLSDRPLAGTRKRRRKFQQRSPIITTSISGCAATTVERRALVARGLVS